MQLMSNIRNTTNSCFHVISIQNIDDSFCVMDLGKLVESHLRWVQTLPNVQPFYAVKCNDDDMLLNILATLGTGFDCASTVSVCINKQVEVCVHRV